MVENALVPEVVMPEHMARLTITYKGEQGDLPDPVSFDATDGDLKQVATEAVRAGIPGIDADPGVDFTDFVVDRFAAKNDVPYNRLSLRPKTPFGEDDLFVVFDGHPGPVSGRFVEVEDAKGEGVGGIGWNRRDDGFWVLGPFRRSVEA